MNRNTLRMPLAEWLGKMAEADLELAARVIAVYAAAFEIKGNEQLQLLTGIAAEKTVRRLKKVLLEGGWVIIGQQKGGRGHGITISPAYQETPVSFTDLSQRNPGRYYPGIDGETPVKNTDVSEQTTVDKPRLSGVALSAEKPAKSTKLVETPVENTPVSPLAHVGATKESTIVDSSSLSEGEDYAAQAKRTGSVIVNGEAIYGPSFKLDYGAIDMTAALIPFDRTKARQIAEVCARDWVANSIKPQQPMAMVKAAILSHHRGEEVHGVRMTRAKQPYNDKGASTPDSRKKFYEGLVKKS